MRKKYLLVLPLSIVAFLLCLPLQPSTDAMSARSDFESNRNNWFGSISQFVYGVMPGGDKYWFYTLSLAQLIMFTFGFILISKNFKLPKVILLTTFFVGAFFSIWIIRDALAFSALMLALGLVLDNLDKSTLMGKTILVAGIILLLVALSIRPYLSLAFILLFYVFWRNFNFNRVAAVVLSSTFVFTPLLIDLGFSRFLNQAEVFPAQQLVFFDLAQMACWSSNDQLRIEAESSLFPVKNSDHGGSLCSNLKPYNWQFTVSAETSDSQGPLRKLGVGDEAIFQGVLRDYLGLALNRPDEIIKIKLRNLNELLFVNGQYDGLENSASPISIILKPIDKLHLFSWIFWIPLITFQYLRKFSKKENKSLKKYQLSDIFFTSGFSIVFISAFFYVGAIGRYTFLATYLFLLGFLSAKFSEKAS